MAAPLTCYMPCGLVPLLSSSLQPREVGTADEHCRCGAADIWQRELARKLRVSRQSRVRTQRRHDLPSACLPGLLQTIQCCGTGVPAASAAQQNEAGNMEDSQRVGDLGWRQQLQLHRPPVESRVPHLQRCQRTMTNTGLLPVAVPLGKPTLQFVRPTAMQALPFGEPSSWQW